MTSKSFKIDVCVVGLKGRIFCEEILKRGLRPDSICSYDQRDDRSHSFGQIRLLAKSAAIEFIEKRSPTARPDALTFFVGWQYLLTEVNRSIVVLHDSLLPRYRGFAPTVTALINGEPEIGVTALHPCAEPDAGPIIAQRCIPVTYPMKISTALTLQAHTMADLAYEIVVRSHSGSLDSRSQNEQLATYSLWRDDLDFNIDWSRPANEIRRFVDAVSYPYLGARTRIGSDSVIVEVVTELEDLTFERRDVGKVYRFDNGRPVVVCGSGLLRLDRLVTGGGDVYKTPRLRVRVS